MLVYFADYNNVTSFHCYNGDGGFTFTAPTNKMHTIYDALFELEDVYHHFAYYSYSNSWPAECCTYHATAATQAERAKLFKSSQQRNNVIRKEANKPCPSTYATAAVPQQQKQPQVSQVRTTLVTNQTQIPYEKFANMCKSVSMLCKQTCDAIVEQKSILTAINLQLDDQRQQLELQRQQLEEQRQ